MLSALFGALKVFLEFLVERIRPAARQEIKVFTSPRSCRKTDSVYTSQIQEFDIADRAVEWELFQFTELFQDDANAGFRKEESRGEGVGKVLLLIARPPTQIGRAHV